MSETEVTEEFAAKLDAFAVTLDQDEQAMLIGLLTGDDDVSGYEFGAGWPGLGSLGVATLPTPNPDGYYEGTVATGGLKHHRSPTDATS